MKNLIALVVLTLFVGCTSVPPASRTEPRVGMTKEEVIQNYGKPGKKARTPQGEVWIYDNTAQFFIPFNFGWTPKHHSFTFNENGLVTDFHVEDF